eukprot:g13991.t1
MHECGELPENCLARIEISDEKISDEKRTGDPGEWDYSIRVRDVISSRSASKVKVRGHVVPFDAEYCDLMDRLEHLASRAAKAKAQKDESGNDNDNDSSREGGHDVAGKLSCRCRLMESQATTALLRHQTIDESDHVSAPIIFPRSLILPKPRPIEKRSGPTTTTGGRGGGRNYPDLVTLVGRGEEPKEEEGGRAATERPGPDGEDAATEGAGNGNKSNRRGRKAGVDLSKVPLFDMFSDDMFS